MNKLQTFHKLYGNLSSYVQSIDSTHQLPGANEIMYYLNSKILIGHTANDIVLQLDKEFRSKIDIQTNTEIENKLKRYVHAMVELLSE